MLITLRLRPWLPVALRLTRTRITRRSAAAVPATVLALLWPPLVPAKALLPARTWKPRLWPRLSRSPRLLAPCARLRPLPRPLAAATRPRFTATAATAPVSSAPLKLMAPKLNALVAKLHVPFGDKACKNANCE